LPGFSAQISALRSLRESASGKDLSVNQDAAVKVVLLTVHPMEKKLEDLRAQGLSGWLLKLPSLEQLARWWRRRWQTLKAA
jgi:hypothetical protein